MAFMRTIQREERYMRQESQSWVVYLMTIHNQPEGRRAVCEQSEWEEKEAQRPGYHKLLQAGISSEAAAELIARGTSGDPVPRSGKLR
jgi:hypothetical protein